MVVKIVTDSGADLPKELAKDLGITVVPLHVLFGDKDYRDGIDIEHEELYRRLLEGSVWPTTSTASPGEFCDVFRKLAEERLEGIVCISLSGKLSKTYGSAVQAKELLGKDICPIEIIDSEMVTMGMGFLAMLAARMAQEGKGFAEIVAAVKENMPRVHLIGSLDTLKYLIKGGRAPKIAAVSDILKIKTFIKIKEGELHAMGLTRKQQEKIARLANFAKSFEESGIEAIAVEYSTNKEDAEAVEKEIREYLPRTPIYRSRLGPALGVHAGPGTLAVSVKTKR